MLEDPALCIEIIALTGCNHYYYAICISTVAQPEEMSARLLSESLQMAALRLDWNLSEVQQS